MQTLSENDIDQLCEQYEDAWCSDTSGVDGIVAFMNRHGIPEPVDPMLVRSLVQVDIERSWMAWSRKIDTVDPCDTIHLIEGKAATDCMASDLVIALESMRSFNDYRPLFPGPDAFRLVERDLACCEADCRDQFGDAVGAAYYKERFGIRIERDADFTPRGVGVEIDGQRGKIVATFPLRGCNRFGRRRSFDTSDLFCEELPEGNRIVIAGFLEAIISRHHFSVQIFSASKVAVRNHCVINPLRVMGHEDLGYRGHVVLSYPFSIRLPGRTLRFS